MVPFSKAGWFPSAKQVEDILKRNGFEKVWKGNVVTDSDHLTPDIIRPDDVILYREKERVRAQHVGYVSEVDRDGKNFIISKWGPKGIYEHEISSIPSEYGPYYEIHRSNRREGRLLKRAAQPSIRGWIRKLVV